MTSTATVFIVDDDPSVLKSLGRLVGAAGFNVAAFSSAGEFLNRPKDDTPACMVLDMQMPELGGFDLQQRLSADGWKLPIIFLTGHGDIPASVRAIKAGAVDFLTKPCEDGELLAAIDQAIALDMDSHRLEADMAELRNRFALLTQREKEVFAHVVAGHLNKQIAYDLGTCEQTIKVHRMRITEKLQVRSLADLARLAEKIGMTPLAPINQN